MDNTNPNSNPQHPQQPTNQNPNQNTDRQSPVKSQQYKQQSDMIQQYDEIYYPDDQPQQYPPQFLDERTKSVRNKQYQMKQLISKILDETHKLDEKMYLGFDWTIMLYQACGWGQQLCLDLFITPQQKHKQLIHYTDKYVKQQGEGGLDDCGVCGEQKVKIFKNICGHQFCQNCWSDHLLHRLTRSFRNPFPPCIVGEGDCPIKMSYNLIQKLCENNNQLKLKFIEVLCRSYATNNRYVKMCKGRPGITCNKCFAIDKMMDTIQCQTCGNLVCPRCGQNSHGPSECFHMRNWKQLTEDSTQFVQFLNYKLCPNCKQAVQRAQGCNFMVCNCKQEFCFICGQKWLPNHKAHGLCPRQKQMQALNQQKKKKQENEKQFYYKIQDRKAKLDSLTKRFQKARKMRQDNLQNIYQQFLKSYTFFRSQLQSLQEVCSFIQKAICVLWGQVLSHHFKEDPQGQHLCKLIDKNLQIIENFLYEFVEKMYIIRTKDPQTLLPIQKDQLTQQASQKFVQQFHKKKKQIDSIMHITQKMVESF